MLDAVYRYRARWSARRIAPWLAGTDRVLDIGAGDCLLDLELHRRLGCEVVPVDVSDANRTDLPLRLYDAHTLPFPDASFDVGLLLFVLHHADDPERLLREARRVCRRRVIAFEDIVETPRDRRVFRRMHWLFDRVAGVAYPRREWAPERWLALGRSCGLEARWNGAIGGQMGPLGSRHMMAVWEPAPPLTVAA